MRKLLVVCIMVLLSGCVTTEKKIDDKTPLTQVEEKREISQKLEITKVSLSKKTIDLNQNQATDIKFYLSKATDVTVTIYNEEFSLIKTIPVKNVKPGSVNVSWDGKDDQGNKVPNGVYTYTIQAANTAGETSLFDLTEKTGGKAIKIEEFNVDKETNDVHYLLPKAGRVRIRIGLKNGGPLLNTLIDWEPRQAGNQKEPWDGKDSSGEMILLHDPELFVIVHAYTIPDNTIIVIGSKKMEYADKEYIKTENKENYFHALHPNRICHEPKIDIEVLTKELKEEIPVLTGVVPIIFKIDKKDVAHVTNSRYEIVFFIDNRFLFEDEEGYTPFTYLLNTKDIPNGKHLITANIVSYDDHIGVVTKKIIVKNNS